jgi:tetratricopeptide (TPR) repeat protein
MRFHSRSSAAGEPAGSAVPRTLVAWGVALALAATVFLGAASETRAAKCSPTDGQALIEAGHYVAAVRAFSCVIKAAPTEVDGYRGRAEALLFLGQFADAYHDYYVGIGGIVLPVQPDAQQAIVDHYMARLSTEPDSITALTGLSFAYWVDFRYPQAVQVLNDLLELRPDDLYGTLFRGSSRVLKGMSTNAGLADLERAIELDPTSPDVHYVVADAYTYGRSDAERAFEEASLAYDLGLRTARVHAILAFAYLAFGDHTAAAHHVAQHIELVTSELLTAAPLEAGDSLDLDLVFGRTYDIPIPAVAGDTISVSTSSSDFVDTIAVLYAPDGTPVTASDDDDWYFAAFDWPADTTGTYVMRVTSFEGVNTGTLDVVRE